MRKELKLARQISDHATLSYVPPGQNQECFSFVAKLCFPNQGETVSLKFVCSLEHYPKTRPTVQVLSSERQLPFADLTGQIDPEALESLSGWRRTSSLMDVLKEFHTRYSLLIPAKKLGKFEIKPKKGGWSSLIN